MTWDKSNKEISRILGLQFHIHLQIKRLLQKQQHLQWLLNEELWTVKYWTKSKLQQYYTVHSWTARCSQVLFLPSHIFPVIVVISSVLVYAAHCNPTLHETQTKLQQFADMSHHQQTWHEIYITWTSLPWKSTWSSRSDMELNRQQCTTLLNITCSTTGRQKHSFKK